MKSLMKFFILALILLTTAGICALEIGTVQVISGKVEVLRASAEQWETVEKQAMIFVNDQVKTEPGTKAKFVYTMDKTLLALKDDSQITFQEYSLMIQRGSLMIQVQKKGSKFEVKTPTAVAGIRGTMFEMDVMPDGATECFVFNGMVYLADPTDKDNGVELSPGKCCKTEKLNSPFGLSKPKKHKKLKVESFKMDKRLKKYDEILQARLPEPKEIPQFKIPENEVPVIVEEPKLLNDQPELLTNLKNDDTEEETGDVDENAVIKGDLDNDGKITMGDIKKIKLFLKKLDLQNKKVKDVDREKYKKCDMNNDGQVNNMDLLILRAMVRKPDGTLMVKDSSGVELRKQYKPNFAGTEE